LDESTVDETYPVSVNVPWCKRGWCKQPGTYRKNEFNYFWEKIIGSRTS